MKTEENKQINKVEEIARKFGTTKRKVKETERELQLEKEKQTEKCEKSVRVREKRALFERESCKFNSDG